MQREKLLKSRVWIAVGTAATLGLACGLPISDGGPFSTGGEGGAGGSAGKGSGGGTSTGGVGGASGTSTGGAGSGGTGSGGKGGAGVGGFGGSGSGSGGTSAGSSGTGGGKGGSGGGQSDGGPVIVNDGGAVPPKPPMVASVAPLAGDYGTEVTITGDDLNSTGATLVLSSPKGTPLTYPMPSAPSSDPATVVRLWSKTEIRFKYPFPAEGSVVVRTAAGQATAGTFVPTWSPGQPLSGAFSKAGLLDVTSPALGKLVAAFDRDSGPTLLVADGTSVTAVAFDRGPSTINQMHLVSSATGGVAGYFAVGSAPTIRRLTLSQGMSAVADTGVALTADAPFFAAGVDAMGEYVWARKTAGQLVRLRAPAWTQDAGPVAEPSSHKSLSGATSPDGSLFIVWGKDTITTFDDYSYPVAARLRPLQSAFAAAVRAGPSADDYMFWTRARAASSGEVLTYYCATDTGIGSPSTDCDEGYLDATGTYQSGARIAVGLAATGSVIAKCEDTTATLLFGPASDTIKQVPILFPCPAPLAAAVDSAGNGLLLVKLGTDVYSPRKR
jgi:hypothetical protein